MKIRSLAQCALFAAVTAVCAWISIPLGNLVFTMQSFAVFLTLFTLGGMKGTVAVLVYLCLGAVGLPVFSGFRGGIGAFLDMTGGYLWGFLAAGVLYWLLTSLLGPRFRIGAAVLGQLLCYACGVIWLYHFFPDIHNATIGISLSVYVLPYLLPDAVKIFLALSLSKRLKHYAVQ